MLRTSPHTIACIVLFGVALLGATAARAADCHGQLQLEAEYFATPIPGFAYCVAAGDWNEDGRPDLVVAHSGSTLTILLGRGGFRMGPRQEIPVDVAPTWVVAADMDGDGHQDLVVTGGGGTRILAGDGAGGFRETEAFPEAGVRAAVGDLDGDGRADIVLASNAPTLTIIFRDSGARVDLPGRPYGAYFAVLADFDHDGDLDLASDGALVWLNDGHGHWSGPTSYPMFDCNTAYMTAGDVNGDGHTDLFAVGTPGGGGGCETLLLGRGDGTFRAGSLAGVAQPLREPRPSHRAGLVEPESGPVPGDPQQTPQSARHVPQGPYFVALADLNGDGKADPIRIESERGHELNGRRSIYEAVMACPADMDGDGKLDMVVAGYNAIAIHPGNGDGTFRFKAFAETYYPAYEVRLGDLDGDGRRDVAVATYDTDELVVALTAADGGVKRVIQNQIFPGSGSIELADFDGDGRLDLLDAYDGIYLGNGDGTFRTPPVSNVPFGVPGDYDEDGRVDVASALVDRVRISFGNGDGSFRTGPEIPVMAWKVRALDVDHDGHLDLVATAGPGVNVIYGRGDGTAAEIVSVPTQGWDPPLSWGDFDGDSLLDVLVWSREGSTVYLSRGRTFVRSGFTSAPAGAAVGDLNGDGFADLMAGGVWFGHGDGTFEGGDVSYGPGGSTYLDDRDGDGLSDVLVVGSYDEDGYENLITLIPNRTQRNRAPVTSAARASVTRAWPPNGEFVDVAIDGITDPDGDPVTITCLGVTQDEPASGDPDHPLSRAPGKQVAGCADATILAGGNARVRLARDGSGNGRVYEITYNATDDCGASTTGRVSVSVPHDAGKPCIDDGQRFNSLACGAAFSVQSATADMPPLAVERRAAGAWSIRYALTSPAVVQLDVFDLLGRRIARLESGPREAGTYENAWMPPGREGVYFVRLTRDGQPLVRRCVVLE